MYYIMCIKSEQFIVYTLIVGRFHDQASPKTDSRLPNDAGSCYDASASLNSNNSNSLQLWTLDTEARNSQEHLAERSNISDFYRRKPASLSVSSCQEATSTPCSTQTLDCASGSGTQRMLRHDCMVATCLPKGWFCQVSVGLVSRCVVHQHGIGVQLHLDPTCWHSVVQPIDVTCCYQKPCGKRAIGNNRNHWCVFHLSSGDNSSFEDVWGSTRNFKLINSIRLLKV